MYRITDFNLKDKTMRIFRLLLIFLMPLMILSCATITRGRTQAFTVTTQPSGAQVSFSNGLSCTTPCTLTVSRRPGFAITVSKEGFNTQTANVASQISGGGGTALAGNVLIGGIIGAGVDASTGAMNELVPNPLHIVLEAE
jgi:hypothetical protein